MNRSIRTGGALLGAAGTVALAGCGAVTVGASGGTAEPDETAGTATEQAGGGYADGTYTATGTYNTPETVETIEVTITLEDDIVTAVEVTGDSQARESQQYQGQFIAGIADEVVGVVIDDLQVDKVAGSSLTIGGFNAALETIKQEAAS